MCEHRYDECVNRWKGLYPRVRMIYLFFCVSFLLGFVCNFHGENELLTGEQQVHIGPDVEVILFLYQCTNAGVLCSGRALLSKTRPCPIDSLKACEDHEAVFGCAVSERL